MPHPIIVRPPGHFGLEPPLAGLQETEQERAVLGALGRGAVADDALKAEVGEEVAKVGLALLERRGKVTSAARGETRLWSIVPEGSSTR